MSSSQRLTQRLPIASFVAITLALIPIITTGLLLREYLVDTPFSDDWTFIEDWIKQKSGTLAFGDLFTAHMEHRVTVARMLALLGHAIGGGDLRWQNVYTFLILIGTWWNAVRILQKTGRSSIGSLAGPMFLFSLVLFCTIQWQGLLWPILFEAYIPVFMLTIAIRVWMSEMKLVYAWIISAVCTLVAMWSFGNGILMLGLVPLLFWGLREELNKAQRIRLSWTWGVFAVTAMGLYVINFDNAAAPQFAYGQGAHTTVGHSLSVFVQKLPFAPEFVTGLLGSHLSRGLHVDNFWMAVVAGSISVAIYAALSWLMWKNRLQPGWVARLSPWLVLGAFSIGTAVLVAMGRLWVSKTPVVAVTIRYVSHAIPLTVALIGGIFVVLWHYPAVTERLRRSVTLVLGAFVLLVATQWAYGWRHMGLWKECRLQGQALLLFTKLYRDPSPLGAVGGDAGYTLRLALEMDKLGIMHPDLLQTRDLAQFKKKGRKLAREEAALLDLKKMPDGTWMAQGYSALPSGRGADLVLFTMKNTKGGEDIVGLGTLEAIPRYQYYTTKRDREYEATPLLTPKWTSRWSGPVNVLAEVGVLARVQAWALDVERMELHQIQDCRYDSGVADKLAQRVDQEMPPQPPQKLPTRR